MDDLIDVYFNNTFTEEQRFVLYRALGLISVYGDKNFGHDVANYIMREQEVSPETIADSVFGIIEQGVDKIYKAHRIILENEPTLGFKVSFFEAIYALSYRELYTPYANILEDITLTNEEKLAEIVEDISGIERDTILEHLSWVYEGTMKRIKIMVDTKAKQEEEVGDVELMKKIRHNLNVFTAAFGEPKSVTDLSSLDIAMGANLSLYITMFRDRITNEQDMEATVWRYLWLCLISKDATENPQKALLEISGDLFTSPVSVTSFNNMVHKAMSRYLDFKNNLK